MLEWGDDRFGDSLCADFIFTHLPCGSDGRNQWAQNTPDLLAWLSSLLGDSQTDGKALRPFFLCPSASPSRTWICRCEYGGRTYAAGRATRSGPFAVSALSTYWANRKPMLPWWLNMGRPTNCTDQNYLFVGCCSDQNQILGILQRSKTRNWSKFRKIILSLSSYCWVLFTLT